MRHLLEGNSTVADKTLDWQTRVHEYTCKHLLQWVLFFNTFQWLNSQRHLRNPLNPILHGVQDIRYYTGGGSSGPPLAKCSLRQPICMVMAKNGSQYKILVFSSPQIPKMVTFDDCFCCERPRNEVSNRPEIHSKKVKIQKF